MINIGLLKAALYNPQHVDCEAPVLPTSHLRKEIQIDPVHCERYNKVVNWKLGIASVIHPSYLQVLTLPMQLQMMVSKPFPFKTMGLVHLANDIMVYVLPEQNAKLILKTSFNGLTKHKSGWVFGVLSEGFVDGALAISATSYYLSRQKHTHGLDRLSSASKSNNDTVHASAPRVSALSSSMPVIEEVVPPFAVTLDIDFPLGIGRRYARISGDYNPIHLTRWTAKLMGFRQAIAHGMYSKAICLSAVIKREMQTRKGASALTAMQFSTQFMQPIYLPTQCALIVNRENDKIDFSLTSQSRAKSREHLRTRVIID